MSPASRTALPPAPILTHVPILRNATPQRFPMYTALAVAVIAALWVARAGGRFGWIRWTLVLAGAVTLLPRIKAADSTTEWTPAFFAERTYASQLRPDENVLLITKSNGEEMAWQETAGFSFRMPEGYIGALPAAYTQEWMFRGLDVNDKVPFVPAPSELKNFAATQQVTAIVIDDLARAKFQSVVQEAGFAPTYEGGGVSVWRPAASNGGTTAP